MKNYIKGLKEVKGAKEDCIKINNPINDDFFRIIKKVEKENKPKKTLDEWLKESYEKYKYLYPEEIIVVDYKDKARKVKLK